MTHNELKPQCPEFPFFGAAYPDAVCIDGYLWDLDKGENGQLYGGGEQICPFCNLEEYLEDTIDELNGITKEMILNRLFFLAKRYGSKEFSDWYNNIKTQHQ